MKFEYRLISKYRKTLMGIAITGILFCHYNECRTIHGLSGNVLSKILGFGTAFVDIFLILSGLGIFYSYNKNHNIAAFYKKRLLRILPTYLFITLPYWIYHDFVVKKLSGLVAVKDILYNVSFCSLVFNGIHRFWFVFAIFLLYLLFPLLYKGLNLFKDHEELSLIVSIALAVLGGWFSG